MAVRRLLALVLAAAAAGCSPTPPELTLDIQLPDSRTLFAAIATLDLTATRDGAVLSHSTFAASTSAVSLVGVSHGARTIVDLEGMDSTGSVIARGSTCSFDFEGAGTTAPLYFAPTNFFAPTKSTPVHARTSAVAMALSDGTVLVAGGTEAGTALKSSELFTPGLSTFAASAAVMNHARARAQGTPLPSIGLLVTGGLDEKNDVVSDAELYLESKQQFIPIQASALGTRVGHRAVMLPDGRTFLSGGSATSSGDPLGTTSLVFVQTDGTFQATAGPALVTPRRDHAATLAVGIPMVFGGRGAGGALLDSIEITDVDGGTSTIVGHLQTARADATASLLADGSILIVGGTGPTGVLADAEIYNPVLAAEPTYKTTKATLSFARRDHTATVLADGRVLVAGGYDESGLPIKKVEIFDPSIGEFVNERDLGTARADHVTVTLCDGTALVVGGGDGAELYTGPAD